MQNQTRDIAKELERNLDHALNTIAQRASCGQNWAIFVWNHLELLRDSPILANSRSKVLSRAQKWERWSRLDREHLAKALVEPEKEKAELKALLSDILKALE